MVRQIEKHEDRRPLTRRTSRVFQLAVGMNIYISGIRYRNEVLGWREYGTYSVRKYAVPYQPISSIE